MTHYVGLEVSLEETKLHMLDEAGNRIWRGRCATEAAAIAAAVRQYAPTAVRIGLETGPLTAWLWTALPAEGLSMACLDARHANKALDVKVNKTDANDRRGAGAFGACGVVPGGQGQGHSAMIGQRGRDRPFQMRSLARELQHEPNWIDRTTLKAYIARCTLSGTKSKADATLTNAASASNMPRASS
jgi:hypothetical protein